LAKDLAGMADRTGLAMARIGPRWWVRNKN
jgi:hypothetical protein